MAVITRTVAAAPACMLALILLAALATGCREEPPPVAAPAAVQTWPPVSASTRQALFDELAPVALKNCTLRRYGSVNDGGYLMCENLVDEVASAYSYGIDKEDNWGCDVSRQLGVVIHQYDCFTDQRPVCDGGRFSFHDQCVGPRREVSGGQPFDTVAAQIDANGDTGKPLIVKMDIEGAEWDSLLATPDAVLDTFVQLPMELHLRGASEQTMLSVVKRLEQRFFLVNLHFNNWSCSADSAPLPSPAFQVLWVNKRVGVLESERLSPAAIALNAPDNPNGPDCQPAAAPKID